MGESLNPSSTSNFWCEENMSEKNVIIQREYKWMILCFVDQKKILCNIKYML